LRARIVNVNHGSDVELDLSETHLVDHTVMEKLHELEKEFAEENRRFTVTGLERHASFSNHPQAGRTRSKQSGSSLNGKALHNGETPAPPSPPAPTKDPVVN